MSQPLARPPLFTIIVAVYNGQQTIRACLESIARQTYRDYELLVMDGGSKDGTVETLRAFADGITYWESARDSGIYNAWNKALTKASGEWLYFLGADDAFHHATVLEEFAERLAKHPSVDIAYGRVALVDEAGTCLEVCGQPWETVRKDFYWAMNIPHQGVFHRRSLIERTGGFDESFRIVGDYEFLLRALASGPPTFLPDVIVANMRVGGISNSPATTFASIKEFRKAQLKHGAPPRRARYALSWGHALARVAIARWLGVKSADRLTHALRELKRGPAPWG